MALTKATYSMVSNAPINVRDYGAVGDGTTDDTAAIQAALNAAVPGGTSVNPPQPWVSQVYFGSGNYVITDTLLVPRGISIVGNNGRTHSGCSITQQTSGKYIFDLYGFLYDTNRRTADQTITGLKFVSSGGAIRAMSSDYASETCSIGSLTIENNHFLNINGDYAILADSPIENISSNTFDYCAVGHIKTPAGSRCTNNMFYEGIGGAIVIDNLSDATNTGYVDTLIVGNNFIGNGSASSSDPYRAAVVVTGSTTVHCLTVVGNTFSATTTGVGVNGVYADVALASPTITGNTFSSLVGNPIVIDTATYAKISDNQIFNCGNSVQGVYMVGIITSGTKCSIFNNTFKDCGGSKNIYVGGGSDNQIGFNTEDTSRIQIVGSSAINVNYSQGTFTPVVTFGGTDVTVASEDCVYSRIGNLISLSGQVTFDVGAATGPMKITGFPSGFPTAQRMPIFAQEAISYPAGYASGMFIDNTNVVYFVGSSGIVTASNSNIASGNKTILFNLSYQV